MLLLVAAAAAHEVELVLEDVSAAETGPLAVELVGPGGRAALSATDDGVAPDATAGDHHFTAHGTVPADNGQLVARGATRTWQGGFSITPAEGRVPLAVRLQADGLAAMGGGAMPGGAPATVPPGVPGGAMPGGAVPGGAVPGGAVPGGTVPGGTPPEAVGAALERNPAPGATAPPEPERGLPPGMWAGWLFAAASLALLGWLAWLGGRAAAR